MGHLGGEKCGVRLRVGYEVRVGSKESWGVVGFLDSICIPRLFYEVCYIH